MPRIARIRFQWGGRRKYPGRWFLGVAGLCDRSSERRGKALVFDVRGLLIWGLNATVAAYAAGAGYVWWILEQRPYNFVRYPDLLLYPLRKERVRELRGQALIAEGMDDIRAGKWREGVMKLRVGLEHYPRDLVARLHVARFFQAVRLRTRAQETLMRGLDFGWPGRAYLENAIELATSGEDYDLAMEIADRGLVLHNPMRHDSADRRWLVEQRLRAMLAAGQYAGVPGFIDSNRGSLTVDDAMEFRLLALIESGLLAEAIIMAQDWRREATDPTRPLRMLARIQRESGDLVAMRASLEELIHRAPANPRWRVFSIIQHLAAGDIEEGRRQVEDYLFRFGGSRANFLLFVQPLGELGRVEELDVVLGAAAERGYFQSSFHFARLQALIKEGRWTEVRDYALRVRDTATEREHQIRAAYAIYVQFAEAILDPSEGVQSSLVDALRGLQLPLRHYRQVIEELRAAGRVETARRILVFANGVFPGNAYLNRVRGELDAEIAARRAAIAAAVPAVERERAHESQETFFAALETLRNAGLRDEALNLIRRLRRARPAWLEGSRESVDYSELELLAEGSDFVALQGAVRAYLTSDQARIRRVIALARDLYSNGREKDAAMMLEEILRVSPGHVGAMALQRRWFPPPETP